MSDKKNYYYNRELSWMDFNARVLEEAQKKDNPLMERLRFLAITGSNLDEFFMVRVAGVKSQVASNYTKPDDSGMTPKELLSALDKKTHAFMEKQYSCLYRSILPVLKKQAGIEFRTPEKLTHEQRAFTDEYFHRVLFPVLTPLAVDSSRPFPMLANKSLNLAVRLSSKENKGEKCFAVVQVPSILPRFTELPADGDTRCFILLEDIITDYLEELFELHEIKAVCPFRITRNSDLTIDEEADDFMYEIEKSIKRRKRGRPVRLELLQHTDEDTRKFLIKALNINESGIYEVQGPLTSRSSRNLRISRAAKNSASRPFAPPHPRAISSATPIFLRPSVRATALFTIHMRHSTVSCSSSHKPQKTKTYSPLSRRSTASAATRPSSRRSSKPPKTANRSRCLSS